MLTFSRGLISKPDQPPSIFNIQRDEFVELVSICLKRKWEFVNELTEDQLIECIVRGKAHSLFERKWSDELGSYHQVLHLMRGYREYAAYHYDICRYQHKGWSAWLEVVEGLPEIAKEKRNL